LAAEQALFAIGRSLSVNRYSAKLLFQYRLEEADTEMRRCEESTVVVKAETAKDAIRQLKKQGKARQFRYVSTEQRRIRFEFVGIMDILRLGMECEANEVWYSVYTRKQPMERRSTLVRTDSQLLERGR